MDNMIVMFTSSKQERLLPIVKTSGSAGADVTSLEKIKLLPYKVTVVRTGLHASVFDWDYYLELYIRSSLASKGLMLANSVGIIDSDYVDEIKLLIYNSNSYEITIMEGERVGQLILRKKVDWKNTNVILPNSTNTSFRSGGFGSTGKF